jgi:hypothetical protein
LSVCDCSPTGSSEPPLCPYRGVGGCPSGAPRRPAGPSRSRALDDAFYWRPQRLYKRHVSNLQAEGG